MVLYLGGTEKSFIDVAGIAAKLGIGHPDLP
jgi:hypothetical protein